MFGHPISDGDAGVAVILGLASAVIHRLTTLAEHRQQFISKFVRFNAGKQDTVTLHICMYYMYILHACNNLKKKKPDQDGFVA